MSTTQNTTTNKKKSTDLSMVFPRFKKFNAFFSGLTGDFEPTNLTEKEKEAALKAITSIDGASRMDFWSLREDLELTATVREARRYANGATFVRFEFKRLNDTARSCSPKARYGFRWSRPYQLMAMFDPMWTLESYTVMPGRDVVSEGLIFSMNSKKPGRLRYEDTEDLACALDHLIHKSGWREVIVYDKASREHFGNINCIGNVYGFEMYWSAGCLPWRFDASNMAPSQIETCLNALGSGGIKALEDAFDWNATVYGSTTVHVDEMLRRSLELAKLRGDEIGASTVRAVGVDENVVANPFRFLDIGLDTVDEMKRHIFSIACYCEKDNVRAARLFALLALRGHPQSCSKLGHHFHSGMGVPVDNALAIYWLEKAVAADPDNEDLVADLEKIRKYEELWNDGK